MQENREVHGLAIFVHGVLSAFHFLGAAYNLRRRNWFDVAAHTAGLVYSAHAALHHAHIAKEESFDESPQ